MFFYIIVKFKCTTRLLKVNYKHSKWHRFVKVMIIGTYSTTQFLKVVNIQQGPMYMESASENRNDAQNVKKWKTFHEVAVNTREEIPRL